MKDFNSIDENVMQMYAELLQSVIPPGTGFGLVMFPTAKPDDPNTEIGIIRYISNCQREDMFSALESMVAKWRGENPGRLN